MTDRLAPLRALANEWADHAGPAPEEVHGEHAAFMDGVRDCADQLREALATIPDPGRALADKLWGEVDRHSKSEATYERWRIEAHNSGHAADCARNAGLADAEHRAAHSLASILREAGYPRP